MVLTHGRPDRVFTYGSLRRSGYTGPIFLVCDSGDRRLGETRERYGAENVLVFDKEEYARRFDCGDNSGDRRAIVFARNAAFDLARSAGFRYFTQLDDDYRVWWWRFNERGEYGSWQVRNLDVLFEALVEFLAGTPLRAVAISQGGDHIGGRENNRNRAIGLSRKCMNTWICDTERRVEFVGRLNEDVTAYTRLQRRGVPFATTQIAQVTQVTTQASAGGMSGAYSDSGTYVKSFFSTFYSPSCVHVASLKGRGQGQRRIHHSVTWNHCAPKFVSERVRRA